MSQIQSGQRHQAVSFEQQEPRSSMSIMLTDTSPDASWNLRIEVEIADGGWFTLGAVNTIPVGASAIVIPNRLIAICSVPGALNWKVTPTLNFGTPQRNRTTVFAEMKLSSVPEYAAGCCPLVPIPNNATEVGVGAGPSQTPTGAPPSGQRIITLFTGPGRALALDVAYTGTFMVPIFAQQHDAPAGGALSDATMVGIGWPFLLPATQTITLRWSPAKEGRLFSRGYTVALSTTQNTYTLPPEGESISAFGQWGPA